MSNLSRPTRLLGMLVAVAIMAASLTAGIAVAKSGARKATVHTSAGGSKDRPARVKPGVGPGQGTGVESLGLAPGAATR